MKSIRSIDGKIEFSAFEFNDLDTKAQEEAIEKELTFLYETHESEEFSPEDAEEILRINEYLFDVRGEIIPLLHYVGNHKQAGKIELTLFHSSFPVTISKVQ